MGQPATDLRDADHLAERYRDLHRHPELSFQETRTAGIVAEHLREVGAEVHEGIGRTGVVGIVRNGEGPTVLLRADMDALPVTEDTGLDYASTATGTTPDGEQVGVMHACGHDVHTTCLLGAAAHLVAERATWSGTLLLVFQPAEEVGAGARAMLDDGLYERTGAPDVVLGQHVTPMPAGTLALQAGPAFAASDTLRITLHGQGTHASRPQAGVDPIVMAAATVLRLQTVVAREIPATETAVVSVGTLHAGSVANVIPDRAVLELSVRTFTEEVRSQVLGAVERIVHGEAATAGAPTPPTIERLSSFPAVVNHPQAAERTRTALAEVAAFGVVPEPGLVTGSEDVGLLAEHAGVPCVYWLLGGADPAAYAGAADLEEVKRRMDAQPTNHSPHFAPVIEPTLSTGVRALVTAARCWLGPADDD